MARIVLLSWVGVLAFAMVVGCGDDDPTMGDAGTDGRPDGDARPDAPRDDGGGDDSDTPDAGDDSGDDDSGADDGGADGGDDDSGADDGGSDAGEDGGSDGGADAGSGCGLEQLAEFIEDDLSGATDVYEPSCGTGGVEVAYEFTPEVSGRYVFDAFPDFEYALAVYEGCETSTGEIGCANRVVPVTVDLTAGETYVVVVEAFEATEGGVDVLVRQIETDCSDDADDDGDGAVDCEDPDCGFFTDCTEVLCGDEADNDGDELADCADFDCDFFPDCQELACANDMDDDGDGDADCDDFDCEGTPTCIETSCENVTDDDGDGDVDCDDFDCLDFVACLESDCTNGLDDDENGDIDCADFDCRDDAACMEMDCTDMVDDDGDDEVDCVDSDCFADPACAEDCDNGADDNGNLFVDCADEQCLLEEPCCEEVCPIADLGTMTGGRVATGNAGDACDQYQPAEGCVFFRYPGRDQVFYFTPAESGSYQISTRGSDYDTVLYVLDATSCGSDDAMFLACNDDSRGQSTSRVVVDLVADETVLIVIDSYDDYAANYALNIVPL